MKPVKTSKFSNSENPTSKFWRLEPANLNVTSVTQKNQDISKVKFHVLFIFCSYAVDVHIHVLLMLCSCSVHIYVHVLFIFFHILFMFCSYSVHVLFMFCWCSVHILFILGSCSVCIAILKKFNIFKTKQTKFFKFQIQDKYF